MQIFIHKHPIHPAAMRNARWAAQVLGAAWTGFNSWCFGFFPAKFPSLMSSCGIFSISFWGVDFMTSTNGANYLVVATQFFTPKIGEDEPTQF